MRLFIALPFDEPTKKQITGVQGRLREVCPKGNFTRQENFHLTLAFLGETPQSKVPAVCRVMDGVLFPPFSLAFERVGSFRRDNGDLWWIGAVPDPALLQMQKALAQGLEQAGFQIDKRKFVPHLTIARQVEGSPPNRKKLLPAAFSGPAEKICLMCSKRIDGRLVYTELYQRGCQ